MIKSKFFSVKRTEEPKEKLIGAYAPISIGEYMSLFCVADNISKSSVIRGLIQGWYDSAKDKFTEKELIALASEKGFSAWENRPTKSAPFDAVLKRQRRELLKKGISEKVVDKIIAKIQKIKDGKNTKK